MTLDAVTRELETVKWAINRLCSLSGYEKDDYLSSVQINPENADDCFLLDQYTRIIERLYQEQERIKKALSPVSYMGYLHKGQNGRYSADNHEMSSGSTFEALVYNQDTERNEWKSCKIEFDRNRNDYYIPDITEPLEGLCIRIREEQQ